MKVVLRHNFRKSSNLNEPEAQNEDCKIQIPKKIIIMGSLCCLTYPTIETPVQAYREIAGHILHTCQNMLGQIPAGVDLTQPDS